MSAKFKGPGGEECGESIPLMKYFRLEGQSIQSFNEELKKLSPADKTELAIGAAKELGFTLVSQ